MKKIGVSALLIVTLLIGLAGCSKQPTFLDSHGARWSLQDFQGKWILLNYWAAWCGECRKEIPALNQFYQTHQKSNVRLVAVDYDNSTLDSLKKQAETFGIKYPILLHNPAKHFKLGTIPALPVTFLISPQGKVVKRLFGPHTAEQLDQIVASASQAQ